MLGVFRWRIRIDWFYFEQNQYAPYVSLFFFKDAFASQSLSLFSGGLILLVIYNTIDCFIFFKRNGNGPNSISIFLGVDISIFYKVYIRIHKQQTQRVCFVCPSVLANGSPKNAHTHNTEYVASMYPHTKKVNYRMLCAPQTHTKMDCTFWLNVRAYKHTFPWA